MIYFLCPLTSNSDHDSNWKIIYHHSLCSWVLKDKENTYSRKKSQSWSSLAFQLLACLFGTCWKVEQKNWLCISVQQEEHLESLLKEVRKSVLHFICKSVHDIKDLLNPARIWKPYFKSILGRKIWTYIYTSCRWTDQFEEGMRLIASQALVQGLSQPNQNRDCHILG